MSLSLSMQPGTPAFSHCIATTRLRALWPFVRQPQPGGRGSKHKNGQGGKGTQPPDLHSLARIRRGKSESGGAPKDSRGYSSFDRHAPPPHTGPSMSVSLESLMRDPAAVERRPAALMQLVSFLVIGVIAALLYVGLSMLMIGLRTGVPDWIVSVGCYALFIVPVYLAHRHYSFRSDVPHA